MTSEDTEVISRPSAGVEQALASGPPAAEPGFGPDLARLRELAIAVPGALPTAVNGVRFAASIRPRKFVVEGGDDTPVAMPRTAFQVVYQDRTIMLDAGMDRETHDSFGEGEPYDADAFAQLTRALDRASLIILTHHHADHVAGVLRAPNVAALARKTLVTAQTLDFLVNRPHRPHLKLETADAARFIAFDYADCMPIAPGVVLMKAPGHSPDSQMAFIRLGSGQEILHSVDAAWNLANVRELKGKAAPWIKEDAAAVMAQLRWLKQVTESEPDLALIITHDGELFDDLARRGIIGTELAA
jgi:glyoxylase-like metal-dependent hydrolase (beta-lactamase superfamily II)